MEQIANCWRNSAGHVASVEAKRWSTFQVERLHQDPLLKQSWCKDLIQMANHPFGSANAAWPMRLLQFVFSSAPIKFCSGVFKYKSMILTNVSCFYIKATLLLFMANIVLFLTRNMFLLFWIIFDGFVRFTVCNKPKILHNWLQAAFWQPSSLPANKLLAGP